MMPLIRSGGTAGDTRHPLQVMVAADGIRRTFGSGHTAVHALRGVWFTIGRGELAVVRGRSGSGKTTLLNIIGGLDNPTAGQVWVAGREVSRMTERERLALRRDTVAFIFQSFGLLPMLSAAENVSIPLRIAGMRPGERRERVAAMLALTGLAGHAAHRPDELSGGQQQRVAIARALAGRPGLLIADEPTSQLDLETSLQIMELLLRVVRSEGITALVATHDEALIDLADRVFLLEDGCVVNEQTTGEQVPARDVGTQVADG
jgi:putative ABC transport system ATP-binding protein